MSLIWNNPLPAAATTEADTIYNSLSGFLSQTILQVGTASGTTNTFGQLAGLTFPQPFPNGCYGIIPMPINPNASYVIAQTFSPYSISASGFSAQFVNLQADRGTAANGIEIVASTAVSAPYLAIGY